MGYAGGSGIPEPAQTDSGLKEEKKGKKKKIKKQGREVCDM